MDTRNNVHGRIKMTSILFIVCCIAAAVFLMPRTVRADEDQVTVDNGIPVIYLNIDESQGTIQEMNASTDHSVYCYGTISIVVPEGFHYSDFPDAVCESLTDLSMSIRGRGNSSWKKDSKKP